MRALVIAGVVGALIGAGGWLGLSALGMTRSTRLADLSATASALPPGLPQRVTARMSPPEASRVFGTNTPAPSLRLIGVAQTQRRRAALVEIGGRAAQWLEIGASREGVTLLDVAAGRAMVDLPEGPVTLKLGQTWAGAAAAATAGPATTAPVVDQVPAGFKSPLPPADAPRVVGP